MKFSISKLLVSLLIFALAACSTYTKKVDKALNFYEAGRMESAGRAFNSFKKGGDVHLIRLEKGMTDIARGDPEAAVAEFSAAVDRMDLLLTEKSRLKAGSSYIVGDTVRDYIGSPCEQICARVFLGLSYLMMPDRFEDVSAVCRDLDNRMEQIEAYYERSYSVDGEGHAADFSFQIPPLAKYFAALAAERRGEPDSAAIYMRQAQAGSPDCRFFRAEAERMKRPDRQKRVFVFGLLGMAPRRVKTVCEEASAVLKGIKAAYSFAKPDSNPDGFSRAMLTAPVEIPGLPPRQDFFHGGFKVTLPDGGETVSTEAVADLDRYVRDEYDTLRAGILIRASIRRLGKEAAGQVVGGLVSNCGDNELAKAGGKLLGDLFASVTSKMETLDTRSWCTLPREIHAACLTVTPGSDRIVLTPVGPNGFPCGADTTVLLDMTNDDPAFVVVVHPGAQSRPLAVVDENHRVAPSRQPLEGTPAGLPLLAEQSGAPDPAAIAAALVNEVSSQLSEKQVAADVSR